MKEVEKKQANRLIHEKSPYLLQHAFNPVDWYPWGEEALKRAKNDGKPIFLSIGYSTCHWCHVLEREAFEDEEIAKLMNKNFISIKVDREERPDLDEVYMKAVQAMNGSGGWPLNVFLTPELKPFYGGTYYPPEPRYGLPSFRQLLEFVAKLWKEKKADVESNGERILQAVREAYQHETKDTPQASTLDSAYATLVSAFDETNGGFGSAPKFPLPSYSSFLLRYYLRSGKQLALKSVSRTLEAMDAGGIHDQLAGGFHRYATDRTWLVPHFEKMLYDNALLAKLYVETFQLTGNSAFAETARGILGWIQTEMTGAEGGVHSAQDADTPAGEGVYYTWTMDEVREALGDEDASIVSFRYGITRNGNFEGRTILRKANSVEAVASKFGITKESASKRLAGAKAKLYTARLRRARPSTDDKILTSWNGLAISAFAYAAQALSEEKFAKAGRRAADFVLRKLRQDGKLLHRYRDGEAAIGGNLEDYAYFVQGLLDLYESTFEPRWLEEALELNRTMVEELGASDGGFYMNQSREGLPVQIKESYDGPTPSGNSVAALNLLRISDFTGEAEPRDRSEKVFRTFAEGLDSEPSAHTFMLAALDYYLSGPKEIVVASNRLDGLAREMLHEFRTRLIPNKVIMFVSDESAPRLARLSSVVEGKKPLGGKPTAYICENFACKAPLNDSSKLRSVLEPKTIQL